MAKRVMVTHRTKSGDISFLKDKEEVFVPLLVWIKKSADMKPDKNKNFNEGWKNGSYAALIQAENCLKELEKGKLVCAVPDYGDYPTIYNAEVVLWKDVKRFLGEVRK